MATPRLRGFITLSILAALSTIVLKTIAYVLTDSVGLLSDALESGINLAAALTAYVSLWYAARPVDASHTYGHEKIEYFSSGVEGVLIVLAGIGIVVIAVKRLIAPTELLSLGVGSILALSASLINLVVGWILLRAGKKYDSIVLEADGQHLLSDVWTSVAVLAGLGLVYLTGIRELDPLLAMVVGCNIMWTGFVLMRRSFDGLMDHAIPEAEQDQLRAVIRSQLRENMAFHALRTRKSGSRQLIDFHLLVPGTMTVENAHRFGEQVEAAVKERFPLMELTIHIEPIEDDTSWKDNQLAEFEPK